MGSYATAISAAIAGTGQCRFLWVGDSYPEGEGASTRANRFLDKTMGLTRTRYSISGSGLGLTPANAYFTYLTDSNAWRSTHTGTATAPSFFGTQGDKGGQIAAGATGITFTVTGDSFDLVYMQTGTGGGGGSLKVFIDGSGTAQTTINTATGTYAPGTIYHGTLGTAGSHSIKVTATTNPIIVDGVVVYNGDYTAGVTYWDDTHTAYSSNQFDNVDAQLGHANFLPHVVIDELTGGNDFLQSTRTPTQMATSLSARITKYKALSSNPTMLFVGIWDFAATSGTNGLGFTFAQYKTAASNAITAAGGDVHYLDIGAVYPTVSGTWLASDALHPSDLGHTQLANAIDSALAALGPANQYAVSGTSAIVTTGVGSVQSKLSVASTASVVSTASGASTSMQGVSSSAAIVSAASAAPKSLQGISSVASIITAATGSAVGLHPVIGSAPIVTAVSASTAGVYPVAGSAVVISTAAGSANVLPAGGFAVSGTANAVVGATGQASLLASVASAAPIASAASGSVAARLVAAGAASVVSSAQLGAASRQAVAATAAVTSAAYGSVSGGQIGRDISLTASPYLPRFTSTPQAKRFAVVSALPRFTTYPEDA